MNPKQPPGTTHTESFNFSPEVAASVDAKLRAGFIEKGQPVLRSARPERRQASPDFSAQQNQQPLDAVSPQANANQNMGKASVINVERRMGAPMPIIRPQYQHGTVVGGGTAGAQVGAMAAGNPFPGVPVAAAAEIIKEAVVPNPVPPVTPVSTADYTSIDLPSRFAYYGFKDLYIKPFRVPHLAKLNKSASSMQVTCEVVSSVLMTPGGDTDIGFKLAIADFNAILYWLRANSFKKASMTVRTICGNPAHHERVGKGEAHEDTLKIVGTYDTSTLKTNYLEAVPDPEEFHVVVEVEGEERRIDLRPETMMDAIDLLDDPRVADKEFQYLARVASYLDADTAFPKATRWTLQERIGIVEDYLSVDDVMKVLKFSEIIDSFGVDELVQVKCKECGHVELAKLTIDARTFLSPGQ